MNLNFAYIEFIKYNKPNMKLSIDEYTEKNNLFFFNGQKLKRLVQTISYFILYTIIHTAANTFIGGDRSLLSCPPSTLKQEVALNPPPGYGYII